MSKRLSGAEWAAELEHRNAEYAANPPTWEDLHPHREETPVTPPQAATPPHTPPKQPNRLRKN
jgi:hypothetical protein